jgi:hypothetical protein
MNQIFEPDQEFPLEKLVMTTPIVVSNGIYLVKYLINGNPLYIRTPKCTTKQGIIKSGKKMYCDLMFTNENGEFIKWIEELENYSQNYIFEKKDDWFESEMDLLDIENSFIPSFKIFKSGTFYILRTNVPTHLGKSSLKIFDEDELNVDLTDIKDSTNIITILQFQGIKCHSKNFQIEVEIKQMMILKPTKLFETCIIRPNNILKSLGETPINDKKNINEIVENNQLSIYEEKKIEPLADTHSILNHIPEILEININIDDVTKDDPIKIVERNDIYYKIYQEAMYKAKEAQSLAISTFLEAKQIKNLYMLDDKNDSIFEENGIDLKELQQKI